MGMIRTFIAVTIPADIQRQIAELQAKLKAAGGKVSWPRSENIHLTLKFLGDTDNRRLNEIARGLAQAAATVSPFELKIGSVGAFPNLKYPRVIWVGAVSEGNQLQLLVHNIEEQMSALGFEKERRPYSAHLTLGRVKDVRGIQTTLEKLQQFEKFEGGSFEVDAIHLIKSELHPAGSIYTLLRTIELKRS
ncbi:MAG: RNA 2',3'-cyclic phosphodiesterase [candidate division KSB1 bacterium]|nr:RNA 2',3'-cyclic phosphodiesterase [candidate division KSB1 bacterium]